MTPTLWEVGTAAESPHRQIQCFPGTLGPLQSRLCGNCILDTTSWVCLVARPCQAALHIF